MADPAIQALSMEEKLRGTIVFLLSPELGGRGGTYTLTEVIPYQEYQLEIEGETLTIVEGDADEDMDGDLPFLTVIQPFIASIVQ